MANPQTFFEFLPSDEFITEYLKAFRYAGRILGMRCSTRPDVTSKHMPDSSAPIDNAWVKKSIAEMFTGCIGTVRSCVMAPVMNPAYSGERPDKLVAAIIVGNNFVDLMLQRLRQDWFSHKVKVGHADRMMELLAQDLYKQVERNGGSVLVWSSAHQKNAAIADETRLVIDLRDDHMFLEISNPEYDWDPMPGVGPLPPLDP